MTMSDGEFIECALDKNKNLRPTDRQRPANFRKFADRLRLIQRIILLESNRQKYYKVSDAMREICYYTRTLLPYGHFEIKFGGITYKWSINYLDHFVEKIGINPSPKFMDFVRRLYHSLRALHSKKQKDAHAEAGTKTAARPPAKEKKNPIV